MTNGLQVVGAAAVLFVFVFLLGYRLSRRGKPYSGAILTVHKLCALGAAVLVALAVYQANGKGPLGAAAWVAATASAVFFVSAIVSGGLLSAQRDQPAPVKTLHRASPYLTVLSTTITLFLLS